MGGGEGAPWTLDQPVHKANHLDSSPTNPRKIWAPNNFRGAHQHSADCKKHRRSSLCMHSRSASASRRTFTQAIMAAPLVGKRVTVNGIAGRAELNGRSGVAETFNDETGKLCPMLWLELQL